MTRRLFDLGPWEAAAAGLISPACSITLRQAEFRRLLGEIKASHSDVERIREAMKGIDEAETVLDTGKYFREIREVVAGYPVQ
jgi:hypothetical protein